MSAPRNGVDISFFFGSHELTGIVIRDKERLKTLINSSYCSQQRQENEK
jgi:hypothetical protein